MRLNALRILLALVASALIVVLLRGGENRAAADAPRIPLSAHGNRPSATNVVSGYRDELAALEHAVAQAPGDTAALLRLARLYHDGHRPAEAVSYYQRYLVLVPDARAVWLDLSGAAAAAGDWESARSATDTLLARNPNDPMAAYNRGAIHANRGDAIEAQRWWEKAARQTQDAGVAARARASLERLPSK